MQRNSATRLAAFVFAIVFSANLVRADWPSRVFAPYVYLGWGDHFKLTDCDDACGQKFYTLAFVIAAQEGRGLLATFKAEPAWDGRTPMSENLYTEQIDAIRKRGGDVLVSFGGEAGKDLASGNQFGKTAGGISVGHRSI